MPKKIARPDPSPAPASGLCTCFRIRRLARQISQHYDRALAPAAININQYSILRCAGTTPRGIVELARELGMDRTTLSRDLKPLVASGWVELRSGADARRRDIHVTAAGKRVVAKAMPLWQRAQDGIEAGIGRTAIEALHQDIDLASARLQESALS